MELQDLIVKTFIDIRNVLDGNIPEFQELEELEEATTYPVVEGSAEGAAEGSAEGATAADVNLRKEVAAFLGAGARSLVSHLIWEVTALAALSTRPSLSSTEESIAHLRGCVRLEEKIISLFTVIQAEDCTNGAARVLTAVMHYITCLIGKEANDAEYESRQTAGHPGTWLPQASYEALRGFLATARSCEELIWEATQPALEYVFARAPTGSLADACVRQLAAAQAPASQ